MEFLHCDCLLGVKYAGMVMKNKPEGQRWISDLQLGTAKAAFIQNRSRKPSLQM